LPFRQPAGSRTGFCSEPTDEAVWEPGVKASVAGDISPRCRW